MDFFDRYRNAKVPVKCLEIAYMRLNLLAFVIPGSDVPDGVMFFLCGFLEFIDKEIACISNRDGGKFLRGLSPWGNEDIEVNDD